MLAGQPSAGKSIIALWMARTWMRVGLRGIYWSADVLVRPAASRLVAMDTGKRLFDVEQALDNRESWVLNKLAEFSASGFQWVFDGSITGSSLELNIDAFRELWGADPDWVVIDNLTDVDTRDGEEFSVLRATMRDVNYLARETNAGMVVLHHTSEEYQENPLAPRKAIHGKVSVKPTIILGTARSDGGHRKPLGPLKNRYGMEDKRGNTALWIPFNPLTLQLGVEYA